MRIFKNLDRGNFLDWRGYVLGIGLVALATWLKYLAQPDVIPGNVPILYILAIFPTAIYFGLGPSLLVCVLSVIAFDYFFIPPLYTFLAPDIQNMPVLIIFFLVGFVLSFLSSRLRHTTEEATREVTARKQREKELATYRDQLEDLVKQRTTELERTNFNLKEEIEERKQAEEALAKAKDELEIRVKERTVELFRANEQLQFYLGEVIQAQEKERKRIARELHDDTSPSLAYLGLELDAIATRNPNLPEEILKRLRAVRDKMNITQQDIRRFSHELHPAVLDNLGLEPALEALVAELNNKESLEIRFEVSGAGKVLPEEVNLALYRITQEALNNAWKHSKATEAVVSLEFTSDVVRLSITDNGIGFDPAVSIKGGLGLTGMRERASLVGANLKVESEPGKGTNIIAEVQL